VSAHARYEDSSPAIGEVLDASPALVRVHFNQDIQRISGSYGIDVTDASGTGVTAGAAEIDDGDRSIMTVPLQPSLRAGRYVVEWRNVSDADGDPFQGSYSFYVGREPTAEERAADEQLPTGEVEEETPVVTEQPAATAEASVTVQAPSDEDDDGGTSGTTIAVIVGAVVAGLAVALVGWRIVAGARGRPR
jgi:methionine-rich copper-binding protein CopC